MDRGLRRRSASAIAAIVALTATMFAPAASAQTVSDIEARDSLIASQEALLNVYRCRFGIDTEVVPGGCRDGVPAIPANQPDAFTGAVTAAEVAARDMLIASQEALLNVYRCRFGIDTEVVPGECAGGVPGIPEIEATPAGEPEPLDAGWLPDPSCRNDLRRWDGEHWTRQVSHQGVQGDDPLGDGGVPLPRPTPGEVPDCANPAYPGVAPLFASIELDKNKSCGIRTNGTIACWGDNAFGQASPPAGRFASISVGENVGCGIRADQTLVCWGSHFHKYAKSESGTGHTRLEADLSGHYTDLAAWGTDLDPEPYVCAIRADDQSITCWGWGGSQHNDPPEGQFTAISKTGLSNSWCGIRADQTLACWGQDASGSTSPPRRRFSAVEVGGYHSCGIRADDQSVSCWGGGLSNAVVRAQMLSPPRGEFAAIGIGTQYSCGIRTSGEVACWGWNYAGQSDPPQGEFTAISVGPSHACAIKADSTIACWGSNRHGQAEPPQGQFKEVKVSDSHSCGIRADSTIACWGSNRHGQAEPGTGE